MVTAYWQPDLAFKECNASKVPQVRLYMGNEGPNRVLTAVRQPANSVQSAREVVFPAMALLAIVASSDVRMPMGLPGHRGLVWLTLLVAVVLVTRARETVLAVGAGSTLATLMLHTGPGGHASLRYLAAAVLLYVVVGAPVVREKRWLVALAAAPIHLVALAGALVWAGMAEKAVFHLVFGLAAGLLGWAIATGIDWGAPSLPHAPRKE